eukprot:XP_011663761.1 PREDICTED: ankycorbin-like [Strongylocentrotus purpuratus]
MALFSAAAKGDFLKIQSLIDSEDKSEDSGGVDVNCTNASGKTPLHIASENGHLQTVKCLTHHGAKVNVIDANLQTSVHLCSKKGHLHVVQMLVNEGADIEIGDKDGFTALHVASFNGHIDVVKYLVTKGAELERLGNDYWTPLHLALDSGHLDIADYLLTEGANINTCEGHLEVVEFLVKEGAGIEIGNKYGVTALHRASFNGHLHIVKYLVSKGADPGKLANEEDHYDYLRSTFGSKALPSLMPRPYSPTYDPYLTSKQDSSSSSRKSITEETKIISLDEYSIKVPISPDDVDRAKYITAEALTTIPHDLKLEKDEVIISVGLKLSPPGLQFKTPVEVTVSHSAIFSNPDKAEIVLYTRRTESDEFARIVPASDKAARCVVAKNHLTLYLDHFSEWWIISLIRRYFIGKRLICTPYVPLSTYRDVLNRIYLVIKDDFCGMKEDTIRDYQVAFLGEQYCVYWGKGPLSVRHLENKEEVSKEHELRCRLNRESPVFDDWRGLAIQMGLADYIQSLGQCKNPTEELLVLAESQKKIQNLGDLAKAFERMNRGDCQELCEDYAFERTMWKAQMEDDDTDTSD